MSRPPVGAPTPQVLVTACGRTRGDERHYVVQAKYVEALAVAGVQALVVPGVAADGIDALLDSADGMLFTGSSSNVHPRHYGEAVHDPALPLDEARDAWTLPTLRRAVDRGVPVFAICRGAQEANVAFGGSLHQAVHEVEGRADHREPKGAPLEVQYGPAHDVEMTEGGWLERLVGVRRFAVNSLHGQAVARLAAGFRVEARSPDGVIESFMPEQARGFVLCVQWHPEWKAAENAVSRRLFEAFGDACRTRRAERFRAAHREADGSSAAPAASAERAVVTPNA